MSLPADYRTVLLADVCNCPTASWSVLSAALVPMSVFTLLASAAICVLAIALTSVLPAALVPMSVPADYLTVLLANLL